FFIDTQPPHTYPLSLHDALPILFALIDPIGNVPIFAAATLSATAAQQRQISSYLVALVIVGLLFFYFTGLLLLEFFGISLAAFRSEEHTSELQSRENLVCRLLLE